MSKTCSEVEPQSSSLSMNASVDSLLQKNLVGALLQAVAADENKFTAHYMFCLTKGCSTNGKRMQNVKPETMGKKLYCCDTWHADIASLPRVSVQQLVPRYSFVFKKKDSSFWNDFNLYRLTKCL